MMDLQREAIIYLLMSDETYEEETAVQKINEMTNCEFLSLLSELLSSNSPPSRRR